MAHPKHRARVKIGRLVEKKSARGNVYFTGALNYHCWMTLLRNDYETGRNGEVTWDLYLEQREDRDNSGTDRAARPLGDTLPTDRATARRIDPTLDDRLDDLWPE
jgi:hypothetical protein